MLDRRTLERLATLYGGLPLLGCLPGSPAARAGLRCGDIVTEVNGVPTPDIDAFIAAKGFRDGTMSVSFVRDGREQKLDLDRTGWVPPSIEDALEDSFGVSMNAAAVDPSNGSGKLPD